MANTAQAEGSSSPLYVIAGALLIVALLLGFAWLPRLFASADPTTTGRAAPDFKVPLVANAEVLSHPPNLAPQTLSMADLKGKAVLLDFWATWCGPCRAEAPIVDRVARRYRDRGLVVVGVNTSDEAGNAAPWAKAHGISYPIAFDQGDNVARVFGVENLPTLVVIGKNGKIVATRMGMTDGAELERLVNQAL